MLRSIFWKPYSRLIIVGDNADWAIDEEAKQLALTAERLGIKTARSKKAPMDMPQAVHYSSQFSLLQDIYKSKHRISVDYFHGKPEQGESFDKCFSALKERHKDISKVRISTREMRELILSSGINAEKVALIPIAIDTESFLPKTVESRRLVREKLGIPNEARVIGSFQKDGIGWGEGDEPKLIKGPDIFLEIIGKLKAEVPDLFVLLSGPARGYVKNGLAKLGVPYKHIYLKDYRQVSDLYDALDLYIIASREEGGPKAALEAMAKGVPLVTTAVGQCRDLVVSGENGLMAAIDDAESLYKYSLDILTDNVLAEKLINNGFQTARENSCLSQDLLWSAFFDGMIEKTP
jgi:glycosyltransferase involved in cell wall biosynthesis